MAIPEDKAMSSTSVWDVQSLSGHERFTAEAEALSPLGSLRYFHPYIHNNSPHAF